MVKVKGQEYILTFSSFFLLSSGWCRWLGGGVLPLAVLGVVTYGVLSAAEASLAVG